jgi:hypothetical protein
VAASPPCAMPHCSIFKVFKGHRDLEMATKEVGGVLPVYRVAAQLNACSAAGVHALVRAAAIPEGAEAAPLPVERYQSRISTPFQCSTPSKRRT